MAELPEDSDIKQFAVFEEDTVLKPRHLRVDDSEWEQYDMTKEENLEKKYTGIVIIISGDPKVGKTHCALSACKFKGLVGEIYDLPAGEPMYYIDTEENARAEYKRNFKGRKVYIREVYIEDDFTLEINSGQSFETVKDFCYSLSKKGRGVIVIDSLSDFCEWLEEDQILSKKKEGTFTPFDYGERNKEIKGFLRKMKHMGMIVIYTTQLKPDYEKTGSGVWDFVIKDDKKIVATRGTEYWGDILIRLDKIENEGKIKRRAIIMGSRFEDETISIKEVVTSNDFCKIMEKIKDKL